MGLSRTGRIGGKRRRGCWCWLSTSITGSVIRTFIRTVIRTLIRTVTRTLIRTVIRTVVGTVIRTVGTVIRTVTRAIAGTIIRAVAGPVIRAVAGTVTRAIIAMGRSRGRRRGITSSVILRTFRRSLEWLALWRTRLL